MASPNTITSDAEELDDDLAEESRPRLALVEDEIPIEPEGMTTWQKVGVGAGITGVGGLAAYAVYKLGVRFGWWGMPEIVIDDEAKPSDGGDKDSTPSGDGERKRATGKPPNISGDPAGYNTEMWPSPEPVRLALLAVGGYKVNAVRDPLAPDDESNPEVERFQRDYNKVIKGIDSGKVKLPKSPSDRKLLGKLRGQLGPDGIPGRNTLNALEIVFSNYSTNSLNWRQAVREAKK